TWLIDPEMDIPEPARRVHGISTEHARAHGMKAADALDEVAALIAEALAKDVPLVAFNIGFDLAILEKELTRLGLPTLTQRLGHFAIEQAGRLHTADVDASATLDVMRALAAKHPQLAASTLEELHREQTGWHLRWAEGMNQWLTKKGKTPDVSTAWPL